MRNISKDKYDVTTLGITKDGQWFYTEATAEEIESGEWEKSEANKHAVLSPDRSTHGILIEEADGGLSKKFIDVIFPVMHGQNSEDGTMQGLLQLSGIPFVGPNTTSSAASMDKAITKAMVEQNGTVSQADCVVSHKTIYQQDKDAEMARINEYFGGRYPLFVKPANAGSSVGITKVKSNGALEAALDLAFEIDGKLVVEEAIVGREMEVAVLGNDDPKASCIGEIFAANEFYDYNAKYENAESRTAIVTDLPKAKEDEMRNAAVTVYKVMGCKGLARVDFFLQEGTDRVVFNELNTIPGFTSISMYPQLWEASGIPYTELIDQLIQLALENDENM